MSMDSSAIFWLYISVSEVLNTSIFRAEVSSIRKRMVYEFTTRYLAMWIGCQSHLMRREDQAVSGNQRESKKTIMFCSRREFDPIEKLTRGCCQCNKTFLLFISIFYFHFYENIHNFITFVIFISCKHLVFVVKTNRAGLKCSEMVHSKNCKTKYYTKL